MMKRFLFLVLILACSTCLWGQSLTGFSEESTKKQLQLEEKFDKSLKGENLDEWMKKLAAKPHHVGSPYGKKNAQYMADLFEEWGYETEIAEYQVLFPTPKERLLEMEGDTTWKASLAAVPVEGDEATAQTSDQLPAYNCFSIDGDVNAELVYVNYGVPADYEELERRGISVKGKIVIARYYGSWRGIKPKVAAEKGAIGCILYSDPRDDGFYQGDVYPEGAYKNEHGVQRGSVLDMPLYPGDPLTPGYGATKDADRIPRDEAPTLTKIPVLPISYADAQPLLASLKGPVAPASWRGGLPLTYHIGPSEHKVHLKLEFDWDLKPAYNVIARMEGGLYPNQWILRGNHHDAWVNGANDPISGMVAVMEEARAIGKLAETGWKPKRTLVYCAWDAEEPGLLGSTEWAEDHAAELRQKAVAYINTDANGRGFLSAGGSHSLQTFFNEITQAVLDPQTGVSVFERWQARQRVLSHRNPTSYELKALGSGSDYTPFIQHLGIAALNVGFGGENGGGEYHTIYDTYDHFTQFKDPGFHYGIALVQVCGRATLRLAEAEILPMRFQPLASTIDGYMDDVIAYTDRLRDETNWANMLVRQQSYKLAADPTQKYLPPKAQVKVPYLNFAPLKNAMVRLEAEAEAFDIAYTEARLTEADAARINIELMFMERNLTRKEGLPNRSWFKHHIYAPGFYTGYGVKTLPGVREAIEQRDWKLAQKQIDELSFLLLNYQVQLSKIKRMLVTR